MNRKAPPAEKRSTRTLDQNHDAKRGATHTDRHERAHGVTLDERGQEQPTDPDRARDHENGDADKRSSGDR